MCITLSAGTHTHTHTHTHNEVLADVNVLSLVHTTSQILLNHLLAYTTEFYSAYNRWSAGAQMVSWLIEVAMRNDLGGVTILGGVFMSGGSYACYNVPPNATGPCADCDPTCGLEGGGQRFRHRLTHAHNTAVETEKTGGGMKGLPAPPADRCPVSTTAPGCSSCGGSNATVKPCCG